MKRKIDDGFGYSGHWKNGKLYVSLRAEGPRGLAVGRGERFDDADQAARWLLVDVGAEAAPKAREALGQLSQTVKQESWVLRALDVEGWARG
jgi:hypothetical protein